MGFLSLLGYFALLSGNKINVEREPVASLDIRDLCGLENVEALKEFSARDLLDNLQCMDVPISPNIAPRGKIATTFSRFSGRNEKKGKNLFDQFAQSGKSPTPIVLLHGFDSSCLEFRRLAPLLAERGFDVLSPDMLGWGFNPPVQEVRDYTPEAKIEHLVNFIRSVNGNKPVVVCGASLGGGIALTLAAEYPELVSKLILLDAQAFIDGDGPKNIPNALAKFGVNVLKSSPLRMFANYIAYKDKSFATFDAMNAGRLHCFLPTWEEASIAFLLSGGFVFSDKVDRVKQDTLVCWGDSDEILEPNTVEKFKDALPRCTVSWFSSGHVPHLEAPFEVAEAIAQFL